MRQIADLRSCPLDDLLVGIKERVELAGERHDLRRIVSVEARRLAAAQISQRVAGVRRFGAASLDLAYVAAGRLDGFWERDLKPWDLAAGVLLIHEAGGKITDAEGGEEVLEKGSVVTANLDLHSLLLDKLKAAA